MITIELYVDHYIDYGTKGVLGGVETPATIAFNNNKILRSGILKEFKDVLAANNEVTYIVPAGRFICLTGISLDDKHYGMYLVDLKNDMDMAVAIARKFDQPQTKALFMNVFDLVRKNYERDYIKVILIKGVPPSID